MNLDWQTVVVVAIVLAAVAYLARSAWQVMVRRKTPGCGTCSSCPTSEGETAKPFVAIDQLAETNPSRRPSARPPRD